MKYLVADNKVISSGSVKSCKRLYDTGKILFRRMYDKVWIQEEREIIDSPTIVMMLQDKDDYFDFEKMYDEQLFEIYSTLQVALVEEGHKEKIVDAFIDCSVEIAGRYFDSKGITDTKARKELLDRMLQGEK